MSVKPFQPEYYNDDEGLVRWRVRGENGEIIDAASEGFANLHKAWDNYNLGLQGRQVKYEEAKEQHDHTSRGAEQGADSGGSEPAPGLEFQIADAQEADGSRDPNGAGESEASGGGSDDSDSGSGDPSPKG